MADHDEDMLYSICAPQTVKCRDWSNVYAWRQRANKCDQPSSRQRQDLPPTSIQLRNFAIRGLYCCRVHFPSQRQLSAAFLICARTGRTLQQPFPTTVISQESRKSKESLGSARLSHLSTVEAPLAWLSFTSSLSILLRDFHIDYFEAPIPTVHRHLDIYRLAYSLAQHTHSSLHAQTTLLLPSKCSSSMKWNE